MILANTSDGQTLRFDLSDMAAFADLNGMLRRGDITALSILHNGTQHNLPKPKKFRRRVVYGAEQLRNGGSEVIGERIFAHVDDIRVSLSMTYTSKMVRCDLVKMGVMQYNPGDSRNLQA